MKIVRKVVLWILASPLLFLIWPIGVIHIIDSKMIDELDQVSDGVLLLAMLGGEMIWMFILVLIISGII